MKIRFIDENNINCIKLSSCVEIQKHNNYYYLLNYIFHNVYKIEKNDINNNFIVKLENGISINDLNELFIDNPYLKEIFDDLKDGNYIE